MDKKYSHIGSQRQEQPKSISSEEAATFLRTVVAVGRQEGRAFTLIKCQILDFLISLRRDIMPSYRL